MKRRTMLKSTSFLLDVFVVLLVVNFVLKDANGILNGRFIDPLQIASDKCQKYTKIAFEKVQHKPPFYKLEKEYKVDCSKVETLISNETDAQLHEYPHMALIGLHNDSVDSYPIWFCSGSLISDKYVLTAAHCNSKTPANLVRLGELWIDDDQDKAKPKDYHIIEHIPYQKYESDLVDHDIMLLKLNESVKFSPYIRPICLNASADFISTLRNETLIMTGWGEGKDSRVNGKLSKSQLKILDYSRCQEKFRKHFKNENSSKIICAGNPVGSNELCSGASGGPLQIKMPQKCVYLQLGLLTLSNSICGTKNNSAVYTEIYSYLEWIQQRVWPFN